MSYALGYSGTGGAVWGYLIASIFIQATAFSMAELCSSMPTAGGLYYAAAVLAPEGWGPVAAWFVGWSNFCGFVTGPCSVNYALAAMLVTAGQIANPEYVPQTWHVYLTLLALLVMQGLVTMQSTWFIGCKAVSEGTHRPQIRSSRYTADQSYAGVNKVGTVCNVVIIFIFFIWFPVGSINSPKANNTHAVSLSAT